MEHVLSASYRPVFNTNQTAVSFSAPLVASAGKGWSTSCSLSALSRLHCQCGLCPLRQKACGNRLALLTFGLPGKTTSLPEQ